MRPLLGLLLVLPLPAFADTIEAPSRVAAVTLYPYGALVAREVRFEAPAGSHTLVIPDLPAGTSADSLRLLPPEGLRVGGMTLATGRQPATGDLARPEVKAAEAEIEALEQKLREGEQGVALLRLRAEAADAQALFLRSIGKDGTPAEGTAASVKALADTIGAEILAARERALAAGFDADAADRALDADREALDAARRRLAALTAESETETLSVTVEVPAGGAYTLVVSGFTPDATWRPVYDLRLTHSAVWTGPLPGPSDVLFGTAAPVPVAPLTLERGVVVEQASGEDWLGVTLVLSTARPSEQSAPSPVDPWAAYIVEEGDYGPAADGRAGSAPAEMAREEPAPAPVVGAPAAEPAGANVTYSYPGTVDLRSGVDALRLPLDSLEVPAGVIAVAAPLWDQTAYVVALTPNTTPGVLLPGEAVLWLDGQMVGTSSLPLVAVGDRTEIGFGAIDGLVLSRTIPERSTGDRGVLSKVNQLDETVEIEVKNLTAEDWQVRLLDRVPYSGQEDLTVRWTSDPAPSHEDHEDQRGVLAWEFPIEAGASRQVRLAYQLRWPSGYVLQ